MTSEQLDDLQTALDEYFKRFCAQTTFLDRLGREGGWDPYFTRRVLNEYKKFLFIVKASGHPVTPPTKIDQAWHLHLLYTESYWGDLCAKVLGMDLHHTPGTGVPAQDARFDKDFAATLVSYRKFFGNFPADIWRQEPKIRHASKTTIFVGGGAVGLLCMWLMHLRMPSDFDLWPVDLFIFVLFGGFASLIIFSSTRMEKKAKNRSNCSSSSCSTDSGSSSSGEGGGFSGGGGESGGGGAGGGFGCGGHGCGGGGGH
jgi:hypothetical protein